MAFRLYLEQTLNETVLNYILANPSSILKSLETQYFWSELEMQKYRLQGREELEKRYTIEKEMVGRFIRSIKEWELHKR